MKQIYIASYFRSGYSRLMKYVHGVFDHPKREAIEQRLETIKFCDEFGFKATKQAFSKSRSTIYLWKQRLKKSGGKLSSLAPGDRTPIRQARPLRKKTRRKGFYPTLPGDLVEIDTVDIFVDGIKRYLLTAIDLPTRFAFAYIYKSSSSSCARDFLGKLREVAPFKITRVQTDNGHEFLKHFGQACRQQHLVHYFNYPRHPQSNAHLERFNRTIQEQFAYWHTNLMDEPDDFNRTLMEYLIWYNTEKVHRSIGKLPPLRYYLNNFVTPQKSNMLWTLTRP